ncbi:serine hydrolase domain-containing protein [Aquimarina sp. W85]|uniref:serine hydrolase domain-containing protein n=1 Tax=Aquimarina rhodophyticola TaxID=3342246 RepID=UPI003671851D
MKKSILIIFLLSISISCKQKTESKSTKTKDYTILNDSLNSGLKDIYEKKSIVGFSVAVVNGKETIFNQGFGYSDLEKEVKYTSKTNQKIASISKTLIAVSLLKAQELGKLNLDDPINKYLPFKVFNPNHPDNAITIRHLATHTSTIGDIDAFFLNSYIIDSTGNSKNALPYDYFKKAESKIPLIDFTKKLLDKNGEWYSLNIFSKNRPGEKFQYSNTASTLCALIIQIATNEPYEQFARRHILVPLKMTNSRWSIESSTSKNDSRHYIDNKRVTTNYSTNSYPENGFITSSTDLAKYLSELINGYSGKGTILTKEGYNELFKKQLSKEQIGKRRDGTLGIFFEHTNDFMGDSTISIGHNGSDPGTLTAMYFNPKTLIGKIVLTNTDFDFDENVMPQFTDIWTELKKYEEKLD